MLRYPLCTLMLTGWPLKYQHYAPPSINLWNVAFVVFCSDLYQNRLISVFLRVGTKTSRKNDLVLKFWRASICHRDLVRDAVWDTPMGCHCQHRFPRSPGWYLTQRGALLLCWKESISLLKINVKYGRRLQKQENLSGRFRMLQANWRQMDQYLGIIVICSAVY